MSNRKKLIRECIFFYKKLNKDIPKLSFVKHYIAYHDIVLSKYKFNLSEYKIIKKIILLNFNPFQIEVFYRERNNNKNNKLLTVKLLLIIYLCECYVINNNFNRYTDLNLYDFVSALFKTGLSLFIGLFYFAVICMII
jgi:hypothetical protein